MYSKDPLNHGFQCETNPPTFEFFLYMQNN